MKTAMFSDIKDLALFMAKAQACDFNEPYQMHEDGSFFVDYIVSIFSANEFISGLVSKYNGIEIGEIDY